MVSNIPNIPLDDNKSVTNGLDVLIDIEPYKDIIVPENNAFEESVSEFETSTTRPDWNIKAKTYPKITPTNSAGTAFILL